MRDAMAAESRGVPTAVAVVGWLDSIAEETKRTGGMGGLPIVPIEKSFFGLSREEIAEAARSVAPAVAAGIASGGDVGSTAKPAPSSSRSRAPL